eukprot:TRINITY_DN3258_c0_g1_i1.p1 TRINITY_DN3258_c0_g1~~TRINITY_DN3258_c0_g1_i1.p1  ORF type:complete len:427 (+),score=78.18 TRINITY_DN3258_c0_g1_i1:1125-2405(+)
MQKSAFTLLAILCCCSASPNEEKSWPISIDFGTTYSSVGIDRNVIINQFGNWATPSYVAFTNAGDVLVGEIAKHQATLNPENTIFDIKHLIGRKFSDPEVQRVKNLYPYKIIDKDGKPFIQITVNGVPRVHSPEEISAIIISKLKETAEAFLGVKVHTAVVTFPAYFSDAQWQALRDAVAIAGLNVSMLNEPAAAAMAYDLDQRSGQEEKKIVVFHLGGRTLEVSVLLLEHGIFEVIATSGDVHLGGEDFDRRVLDHLMKEFKANTGKDVSVDKRAMGELKMAAERTKRQLSIIHRTETEIEDFVDGEDFSQVLTREKFEELNDDLFKMIIAPIEKVLAEVNLKKSDVDFVVLSGGSTRIPKIQQLLSDFFEGKKLLRDICPEEVTASGASRLGHEMATKEYEDVHLPFEDFEHPDFTTDRNIITV